MPMKLELFMPLQGKLLEGQGSMLNEKELCAYEKDVKDILTISQAFSCLQDYKEFLKSFEGDAEIPEKIVSMEVKAEVGKDALYGILIHQISGLMEKSHQSFPNTRLQKSYILFIPNFIESRLCGMSMKR